MIDLTQPVVPPGPRGPVPFWRRVFIFCAISACCFLFASLLITILAKINSGVGGMRLVVITQDVVMFIAPALAVAAIMAGPRRLWQWLGLDRLPALLPGLVAIAAYFVSIPLMEWIVDWNAHLQLPDAFAGIEQSLKDAEQAANASVSKIIGAHTTSNLIFSLLIIGILTGFAEETFFRGGLQRILYRPGRRQLAVWIAAFIFSLLHFQFYGFIPRLLLGALFGYVFLWTGSLWTGILLHALNNSLTLVMWWRDASGPEAQTAVVNAPGAPILVIASALATALALWILWRMRVREHFAEEKPVIVS